MRLFLISVNLVIVVHALPANALDSSMGPAGFSGLAITPTARIQNWGEFSFTYDNQLPGITRRPSGHNLVAGFGLLPNLEIAGRIATNEVNSNCYVSACGARDMSGSGKFGIGIDAEGHYRIAVGATDLGGKVSYFTSYYGVLTYSASEVEASLGLAKRKENGIIAGFGLAGSQSPLNGVFGNLAFQPNKILQANIEFSDRNAWSGLKIFAPQQWLPQGWRAYVGANLRLNDNKFTEKMWISAGVSIPLYSVPDLPFTRTPALDSEPHYGLRKLPVYQATMPTETRNSVLDGRKDYSRDGFTVDNDSAVAAPGNNQIPALAERFISVDQLEKISIALKTVGFEDISIGFDSHNGVAIRLNNATYNWNALDALGVAIGVISREAGDMKVAYSLILKQRQVPLVAVTGQLNCLRDWVLGSQSICTAGQLFTPGTQDLESFQSNVKWVIDNIAPSWQALRIGISPALNSAVATEYGLFDYSLGARVSIAQPLWSGAYFEVRRILPVASSDDFRVGKVYGESRLKSSTDRVIFSQISRIPVEKLLSIDGRKASTLGLTSFTGQVTAGRINEHYDGIHGELRWEPNEGRHRFGVEGGRFRNADFRAPSIFGQAALGREPEISTPVIASYRYAHTPTRTYFELSGGQYMFNDRGFYAGISQWFGDVAVSIYYRRTKFESDPSARQFVGVQVSLPIGPRKDMSPNSHVQITGNQRVGFGVETLVRADGLNYISTGHGVLPGVPVLNEVFNSDRAGLVYFEDNMRRIRDAARNQ